MPWFFSFLPGEGNPKNSSLMVDRISDQILHLKMTQIWPFPDNLIPIQFEFCSFTKACCWWCFGGFKLDMSAASIKVKQSGKITEVVLYVAFSWPVIPAPIRKHLMRTTGLIMQNTNTGRNTKRKIHKIHDSISLFQLQSKAIFTSEFINYRRVLSNQQTPFQENKEKVKLNSNMHPNSLSEIMRLLENGGCG